MRKVRTACSIMLLMLIISICFASSGDINMDLRLASPGFSYPFGCDSFGRSLLSRTSYGFLVSLSIGMLSSALSIAISLLIAFVLIKAERLRIILFAVLDSIKAVPSIVLALFLASISGPGIINVIAVLVISFTPSVSRTFYSLMDDAYRKPFVEAAYSEGSGEARILISHILPHIAYYIREEGVSLMLSSMLIESSLSFIGAGVELSTPSLGLILQEARPYMLTYPHMAIFPSLVLILLTLSLLLLSRGLAELDPASHRA